MNKTKTKKEKRNTRHRRIRAKVSGSAERPRLALFRSNTAIYGQIIDDEKGSTLSAASSRESKGKNTTERARETGILLAKRAAEKKVTKVVFDRGGFLYAGVVKAFADGAREGGLIF